MGIEKLSKSNRETLLIKSEEHIGEVTTSLNLSTEDLMSSDLIYELDSKLTDLELLEQWNHSIEGGSEKVKMKGSNRVDF